MERSTSALAYNGDNEKGGTIVESAVTLPVLFLILFGILMFGRAFNVYQTITDAAHERPIEYGIFSVLLAVITGWTASYVFRKS